MTSEKPYGKFLGNPSKISCAMPTTALVLACLGRAKLPSPPHFSMNLSSSVFSVPLDLSAATVFSVGDFLMANFTSKGRAMVRTCDKQLVGIHFQSQCRSDSSIFFMNVGGFCWCSCSMMLFRLWTTAQNHQLLQCCFETEPGLKLTKEKLRNLKTTSQSLSFLNPRPSHLQVCLNQLGTTCTGLREEHLEDPGWSSRWQADGPRAGRRSSSSPSSRCLPGRSRSICPRIRPEKHQTMNKSEKMAW